MQSTKNIMLLDASRILEGIVGGLKARGYIKVEYNLISDIFESKVVKLMKTATTQSSPNSECLHIRFVGCHVTRLTGREGGLSRHL